MLLTFDVFVTLAISSPSLADEKVKSQHQEEG